jgi:MSHA biogenesis protein MshJ
MPPRLTRFFNRLEALSPRERLMAVVGAPLLLVLIGEGVVFDQMRKLTADAARQADRQAAEVKALRTALDALPADTPLPAPEQLRRQRDELQGQVDAARRAMGAASGNASWAQVLRGTLSGTPGLTLAQLRTQPPEVLFSPAMLKPAETKAAKPAAPAAPGAAPTLPATSPITSETLAALGIDTLYRHRAELTVGGDVPQLLRYLQSLEAMPRDVRWDRVQVSTTNYPQASLKMTVFTLSRQPRTPFD